MNPILQEAIGSLLRWAFAFVAGWLVQHGIWTQSAASTYVAAAALGVVSIGWSLWQKYESRIILLTALTMTAGTTENGVKAQVASGVMLPTVLTPPDTIPGVPKGDKS